jgi:hypothetical protein
MASRPSFAGRERLEQQAKPWIERVARLGFGAKGIVYVVIGILATQAALGRGGSTTDARGALRTIAERPMGSALLLVVALGLLCYALWRFVEAWTDAKGKGSDAKGIATRVAYAIIGVFYIGLAVSALAIARGGEGGGGAAEQGWTARVLAQPFGRVLVGLAGVGVLAFCMYRIYKAVTGRLSEPLDIGGEEGVWAKRVAAFGLGARSVVFGLIGLFLIQAALRYDPAQAGGLDEALQALASQPTGPALLGVVAVGLVAYGIYMLLVAWYRRSFVK